MPPTIFSHLSHAADNLQFVSNYEHSSQSDGDTESSGTHLEGDRRSGISVVSNGSAKSDCSSLWRFHKLSQTVSQVLITFHIYC